MLVSVFEGRWNDGNLLYVRDLVCATGTGDMYCCPRTYRGPIRCVTVSLCHTAAMFAIIHLRIKVPRIVSVSERLRPPSNGPVSRLFLCWVTFPGRSEASNTSRGDSAASTSSNWTKGGLLYFEHQDGGGEGSTCKLLSSVSVAAQWKIGRGGRGCARSYLSNTVPRVFSPLAASSVVATAVVATVVIAAVVVAAVIITPAATSSVTLKGVSID